MVNSRKQSLLVVLFVSGLACSNNLQKHSRLAIKEDLVWALETTGRLVSIDRTGDAPVWKFHGGTTCSLQGVSAYSAKARPARGDDGGVTHEYVYCVRGDGPNANRQIVRRVYQTGTNLSSEMSMALPAGYSATGHLQAFTEVVSQVRYHHVFFSVTTPQRTTHLMHFYSRESADACQWPGFCYVDRGGPPDGSGQVSPSSGIAGATHENAQHLFVGWGAGLVAEIVGNGGGPTGWSWRDVERPAEGAIGTDLASVSARLGCGRERLYVFGVGETQDVYWRYRQDGVWSAWGTLSWHRVSEFRRPKALGSGYSISANMFADPGEPFSYQVFFQAQPRRFYRDALYTSFASDTSTDTTCRVTEWSKPLLITAVNDGRKDRRRGRPYIGHHPILFERSRGELLLVEKP
jgi:hypothetical protein